MQKKRYFYFQFFVHFYINFNKYKIELKELNNKTDELNDKYNEINNIIENLKPTIMNKNNFTISSEDIDKIKN